MNPLKIFSFLLTSIIIAFLIIWFGLFNISAKEKHWEITTILLEFIRERSIEVRAEDIQIPNTLSTPEMISNGAKNFDAMCAQCHLAPEMEPTELHLGLYPQPPIFYKAEKKHETHGLANTFWVIQNGLKLTGMPAWGDFHTDTQIWEMVAFLNVLKGMSATEYRKLVGEGGHTHKEGFTHSEKPHGTDTHQTETGHHINSIDDHTTHGTHDH